MGESRKWLVRLVGILNDLACEVKCLTQVQQIH